MAFITPNDDITEILEIFGFGDMEVTSFKLIMECDSVVSAEVGFHVKVDSIEKIKHVLKKYKLVEKKVKVGD